MGLKSALFLIFQLVIKMYVFRRFVSMLRKYRVNISQLTFLTFKFAFLKRWFLGSYKKYLKKFS